MPVQMNPYLNFKDTAREAMEFYQSVFGGKLTATAFKDGGMPFDPAEGDRLMHAQLEADNGMVLMGADTPGSMEFREGANGTISLSGDDESTLRGYFDKLADGGMVVYPLDRAPWGDLFGMCKDKFGVGWMVNVAGENAGAA